MAVNLGLNNCDFNSLLYVSGQDRTDVIKGQDPVGLIALFTKAVGEITNPEAKEIGSQILAELTLRGDAIPADFAWREQITLVFNSSLKNAEKLNDVVSMDALLKSGFSNTSLHEAASLGRVDVVKFLLQSGVEIDTPDEDGDTALQNAAGSGHVELVQYFIELGANPKHASKDGDTALHLACEKGHIEVVRILVASGVDLNQSNVSGETPLSFALQAGNQELVQLLTEKGAV